MKWLNTQYKAGSPTALYAKAASNVLSKITVQEITTIHFGQLRIAANFAQAETIYTPKGVAGQSIETMGSQLQLGASPQDLLMVKVFQARRPVGRHQQPCARLPLGGWCEARPARPAGRLGRRVESPPGDVQRLGL